MLCMNSVEVPLCLPITGSATPLSMICHCADIATVYLPTTVMLTLALVIAMELLVPSQV